MDVVAVREATAMAAPRHVRDGGGPFFLEFRTYRFRAALDVRPELYRDKAEVEAWKTRGPIHSFTERLKAEGSLTRTNSSRSTPRRRPRWTRRWPSPRRAPGSRSRIWPATSHAGRGAAGSRLMKMTYREAVPRGAARGAAPIHGCS
jgi:hypothetical protein